MEKKGFSFLKNRCFIIDTNDLKLKIKHYVKKLRIELPKLPEDRLNQIALSDKEIIRTPCQITIIWMQETANNRNLQIFIFTHFDDLEDLQVDVVGPLEPPEFISTVEELLNEDKWLREVKDPQAWVYQDGNLDKPLPGDRYPLSAFVSKIVARAYDLHNIKPKLSIYDSHFWVIHEKFQDIDIEAFIELSLQRHGISHVSEKPIKTIKCQYTYFYPPCWIGPKPVVELRDRINDVPAKKYIKSYFYKIHDRIVVCDSNGYIAIESDNWDDALELINLFMAVISISGRGLMSAGRWDLAPTEYQEYETNKYRIRIMSIFDLTARSSIRNEMNIPISQFLKQDRILIQLDEYNSFLRIAEDLFENGTFTKSMLFHFESLTEYSRDKYPQALILSWITIERYINMLWDKFIKENEYTGKRKEFLNDVRTWTAASKVELLNVAGLVNDEDYKSITKYRKARNYFVHDKEPINQELALECLEFTKYIVFKILGETESKLVKEWIKKFKFIS